MSLLSFLPAISGIIDKLIPDPEAKAKAKLDLIALEQAGELKELEAAARIIEAEAKSEHWLVAAWRPLTMMVFVVIIANNYLLVPYLNAIFGWSVTLDIPPDMWGLLETGILGYVVSRSAEKIVPKFAKKK